MANKVITKNSLVYFTDGDTMQLNFQITELAYYPSTNKKDIKIEIFGNGALSKWVSIRTLAWEESDYIADWGTFKATPDGPNFATISLKGTVYVEDGIDNTITFSIRNSDGATFEIDTTKTASSISIEFLPETTGYYTVTYESQVGGDEEIEPQIKEHDKTLILTTQILSREGYSFIEWNTKSDGSGISYQPGSSFTGNYSITLYGIWKKINEEFTLSYNLNGGTGRLGSQTHNGTLTLHSMLPTKEGYTFINWNTKSDGTGISHQPSATITVYQDLVLYAIWEISTNVPDGSESVALPTLNITSVNELDSLTDNVKAIVELNGELSKLSIAKITNEGGSADIQAIRSELKEMNDEITAINNKNTELESDINFLVKNDAYATGGSGTGWSASDEVAIGTWIDGKTIYRKAWQLNMDARSKTFNVGFDRSNVDVALRMDVMCTCEQGLTPLYADTSHTTTGTDYFRAYFGSPSNGAGCLCVGGGTGSPSIPYTAIVILEYTKK